MLALPINIIQKYTSLAIDSSMYYEFGSGVSPQMLVLQLVKNVLFGRISRHRH